MENISCELALRMPYLYSIINNFRTILSYTPCPCIVICQLIILFTFSVVPPVVVSIHLVGLVDQASVVPRAGVKYIPSILFTYLIYLTESFIAIFCQ